MGVQDGSCQSRGVGGESADRAVQLAMLEARDEASFEGVFTALDCEN